MMGSTWIIGLPIEGHEKGNVVRGSRKKLGHTLHYLKGDISISVFEWVS